jgi:uncharacterized protein
MRPGARRTVVWIAASVVGCYVALCVIARLWYPRVLFPAPRVTETPPGLHDALVELPQRQGPPTRALHFPAKDPRARTVVLFHGNGETIFDEVPLAKELARRGLGVLLVEYRGYGLTYGPPPSEEMVYDDGEAAIAHLAARGVAKERVVLWGSSLGAAVALEMARRGHGARVVLLAPFTSVADVGRSVVPMLPVGLLLTHRFDNLAKAPALNQPTVVVHGEADEIIPFAMGASVAKAIPRARLVAVAGAHHNDLLAERGGTPTALELLDILVAHLGAD